MVIDEAIGDKVRVTVIATGFGDAHDRVGGLAGKTVTGNRSTGARPQVQPAAKQGRVDETRLDIPTYIRENRKEAPEVKLKKISVISSNGEDDKYEIPTFLRRQAD